MNGGGLLGGLERSDGTYLNSLSASAISTLFTCPEKFRLSYLLLKWGKANAATTLGHAYHYALQRNFEQKVWSRADLSQREVLAAYEDGWAEALAKEDIQWRSDDPAETKALGAEMVKLYHQRVSPTVQPIGVEEYFEAPIPGVGVPLIGRVDLLQEGHPGQRPRIIDRKTAKSGATKAKPEWRVQARCYLAVFPNHEFGWHVQAKAGKLRTYTPDKYPGLVLHNTPGGQRTSRLIILRAWEMLNDFYDRYGLEQPWPGTALAHPYACTSCVHRSKCVYWV